MDCTINSSSDGQAPVEDIHQSDVTPHFYLSNGFNSSHRLVREGVRKREGEEGEKVREGVREREGRSERKGEEERRRK